MRWFLHALRHSRNIHGRASRTEFWSFQLTAYALTGLIAALGARAPAVGTVAVWGFNLLIAPASLAVSLRRLHDIGYSGALLKRLAVLGIAQFGIWMGVWMSRGTDSLALAAACMVSALSLLLWVGLLGLYCRAGHPHRNDYGSPAPPSPTG